MTCVAVALWLSLYIFVLSTIVGVGGLFNGIAGENLGGHVIDVAVAVNVVDCASIFLYFLHSAFH